LIGGGRHRVSSTHGLEARLDSLRMCKECRQALPENAPEGLCPACLAKVALWCSVGSCPATA